MNVEITPEPTAEERAALLAALAAGSHGPNGLALWWQAGVREAVGDEPDPGESSASSP